VILLPNEGKTFFRNWLGLLAFVNDRHNLVKGFGHPEKAVGLTADSITKIKTKLWENVDVKVHNVQIGPNMSRSIQEHYGEIKEKKGISGSLTSPQPGHTK